MTDVFICLPQGAIAVAERIVAESGPNAFMLNQFSNPDNPKVTAAFVYSLPYTIHHIHIHMNLHTLMCILLLVFTHTHTCTYIHTYT